MTDRYLVRLSDDQQQFLDALIDHRRCSPTTLVRALILRMADVSGSEPPRQDQEIARKVFASTSTVYRVRKRFAEHGFQVALFSQGRAGRPARVQ
jgi:hypothetical protein